MFGNALRLVVLAAVLFVAYKGMTFYSALKFAEHMTECTSTERLCELVERQASGTEIGAAMRETFACIKTEQSWFEPLFFPIDKELSDPPAGSIDYKQAAGLCEK